MKAKEFIQKNTFIPNEDLLIKFVKLKVNEIISSLEKKLEIYQIELRTNPLNIHDEWSQHYKGLIQNTIDTVKELKEKNIS